MGKKRARKASKEVAKEKAKKKTKPALREASLSSLSDNGGLFVGIDLGTSQASITASNGVREVVPTYVGYPKDNISRELLGANPLFGKAALKHRLSVELIRPLAHGVIQGNGKAARNKHLVAAQQLVRHLLELARPEHGQSVYGVIGAPARASTTNKQILVEAARGALDAVMIVSEPFTVAYGMGILDEALVIDIGAGTIDLCRLHGTLPQEKDQITLDEAGDFVDEKLSKLIKKKYPQVQFNTNMVKDLKERYGFVSKNADNVAAKFPVKGRPNDIDITAELRASCKSIVPGIVNSIAKLIATFDPEFQEVIRSNVVLAGGGSQMIGLPALIENKMEELGGGRVTRVDEPLFAGSNGALKMAQRMPKRFWNVLV